jgi:hypothetical protein
LRQRMTKARFARAGRPIEPAHHDRRSTDLLKNAIVVPDVVDDQYGDKIVVWRSRRDDILFEMLSKREIDQAQFDAGRTYERHAEHAQIGSVQAMDPGKVKVDGGGWGDVLSNKQINATRALSEARRKIGPIGDDLVRNILVNRMRFNQLAYQRAAIAALRIKFFTYLEQLGEFWGTTGRQLSRDALVESGRVTDAE